METLTTERGRSTLSSLVGTKDRECDFYTSPTILSRLIQNGKYTAAMQRLEKRGPAEAGVWVCSKRAEKKFSISGSTPARSLTSSIISYSKEPYGFRQLPLHMACEALYRVVDPGLRQELEALIVRLVLAYPEGASRVDHERKLPLHEAIFFGASPETISSLLIAFPAAVEMKDSRGRYPAEINEHSLGGNKQEIQALLRYKGDFWKAAGREAHLRLKHRNTLSADASVASVSVLGGSIRADDDTLVSSESFDYTVDPSHPKAANKYAARVQCMQWTQLERRAMTLESKLAESYEQNYKLKQALTELTVSKKLLQKKVKKLMADDNTREIAELVMEREELRLQVQELQSRLRENGLELDASDDHPETLRLPMVVPSEVKELTERVEELNEKLCSCKKEHASYKEQKEREVWALEKKLEVVTADKDNRIQRLEERLEESTALQTSPSVLTGKTISEFTRSLVTDDDTISTSGSSEPHTPFRPGHDDDQEVDAVLQNAIRLNGGQGLSPCLIELWNKMSLHTHSLGRISEDTSYDEDEERNKDKKKMDDFDMFLQESVQRYGLGLVSGCRHDTENDDPLLLVPALDHAAGKDLPALPHSLPKDPQLDHAVSVISPSCGRHTSGFRKPAIPQRPRGNLTQEVSGLLPMSLAECSGDEGPSCWSISQGLVNEVSELSLLD